MTVLAETGSRRGSARDSAKRIFDLASAVILSVLLVPVGICAAIAIRLESPGPVLFRQGRVGKDGRIFDLFKFRSMRLGSEGPIVTAGSDPRITPVGRFLRNWKVDELPQLINVIIGDMSLVGPRPEVPDYVAYYTEDQRRVLTVRPGITGMAQLKFRNEEKLLAGRADVDSYYREVVMQEKLALDLQYIEQRSMILDLKILFRTVLAVFR